MTRPTFRLVDLPWSARLGLAALVLVLLGGLAASAAHLFVHHENRDERPGLSLDDLTGAYHGIRTRAPLLVALEAGHPDDLPAAERDGLLAWLGSADLAAGYDDLELGERAPAEIVDRRCLRCHARQATEGEEIGKRVPLEYWDDVRSLAVSRDVTPTAAEIVLASLHTHALGMGTLSVIAILLACATRWRRGLVGALALLSGLGLALDLAAWLPARDAAFLVPVLAVAGGTWISATGALLLLGLVDLLRPGKATADV